MTATILSDECQQLPSFSTPKTGQNTPKTVKQLHNVNVLTLWTLSTVLSLTHSIRQRHYFTGALNDCGSCWHASMISRFNLSTEENFVDGRPSAAGHHRFKRRSIQVRAILWPHVWLQSTHRVCDRAGRCAVLWRPSLSDTVLSRGHGPCCNSNNGSLPMRLV